MAATGGPLEEVWHHAVTDLLACIQPGDGGVEVLHEGGVYRGTWLESTGTISAEVLGRFLPAVATDTFRLFADRVRADGLLPYKVTDAGPAHRHIQIVTCSGRTVPGTLVTNGVQVPVAVAGNERVELDERGAVTARAGVPIVRPTS